MANIAVLGSTGMLGSAMIRVLRENSVNVIEFNRSGVSARGVNKSKAFDAIKKNDLN